MAIEVERKLLVSGDFLSGAINSTHIVQGYIYPQPGCTVRIRIRGEEGFLTIKGTSDEKGLNRYEFEQKTPLVDTEWSLKPCKPGAVDKVRYLVPKGSRMREVNVPHGANKRLILMEIELSSEDKPFERPAWLSKGVGGDRRHHNSVLTKHLFNNSNT